MSNWYEETQKKLNKNKMEYPQEFIDKCLKVYPNDEVIKTLLDDKSFLLGAELEKRSKIKISSEELAESGKKGTTSELVKKADTIKAAKELLSDFIKLYDEQYRSKGNYIRNGLDCYSDEVLLDYKIRTGKIKVEKVKIDPVYDRVCHEALVRRLEQNEDRRREGARIAGEYWTR